VTQLPPEIVEALEPLVAELAALGYVPGPSEMSLSFGNFVVSFDNGSRRFQLTRDKSQFIVGGERAELERLGLWRAFNSIAELEPPLMAWLKAQGDA